MELHILKNNSDAIFNKDMRQKDPKAALLGLVFNKSMRSMASKIYGTAAMQQHK
jgi:hypothetical protein